MEAGSERCLRAWVLVPPMGETKSNIGLRFWPITTFFHLRAGGLGRTWGWETKFPFSIFYMVFIKDLLGEL